jgi:hypothetical protein
MVSMVCIVCMVSMVSSIVYLHFYTHLHAEGGLGLGGRREEEEERGK